MTRDEIEERERYEELYRIVDEHLPRDELWADHARWIALEYNPERFLRLLKRGNRQAVVDRIKKWRTEASKPVTAEMVRRRTRRRR